MDPVTLGIAASIVTVLAFFYMLIFGQRGLVDWLERRRQMSSSASSGKAVPDAPALQQKREIEQALESDSSSTLTGSSKPKVATTESLSTLPSPPPPPQHPQETTTMDKATLEFIRHIVADIEAKSCVFLLGAGVSIEAGLPGGASLAQMLARKAGWEHSGRPLQQMAQDYATMVGPVKPVIQD